MTGAQACIQWHKTMGQKWGTWNFTRSAKTTIGTNFDVFIAAVRGAPRVVKQAQESSAIRRKRCDAAPVLWHNNNRREGYLFRASREWRRRKALFGSLWLRCFVHMCAATVTSLSLSPPTSSLYQLYLIASSRIGDKRPTAKIIQSKTSFVRTNSLLSSTEIYFYVWRGKWTQVPMSPFDPMHKAMYFSPVGWAKSRQSSFITFAYIGRSLPQWLMGITLFARNILGPEILLPTGWVKLGN